MAGPNDIAAWIAFFMGLYSLAAAVGEWRNPGTWAAMVEDFGNSAGLRFLTGIVCIALGAAIYLATADDWDDWLAVLVCVIGGIMVVEGMAILAAGDRFIGFARRLLGKTGGVWVGLSALLGAALVLAALSRIGLVAASV